MKTQETPRKTALDRYEEISDKICQTVLWTFFIVIGTIFLLLGYGAFIASYYLSISRLMQCAIFCIGSVVMIGMYLLFEKCYRSWNNGILTSGIKSHSCLKNLGRGMLLGIGMFCAVTIIMALLGDYRIQSVQFNTMQLVTEIIFYLLVAVSEECINRGIIFRMIDDRWGFAAALVVSSFLFGLGHIFNDEATIWGCAAIAIESGVLFGAAYKMSGSLWLPIGIHWTWNVTQGDVFGFIVSGNPQMVTPIITPKLMGSELISGGAFGAEASIISVILGLAIACWMIYKVASNKQTVGIVEENQCQ